MLVFISLTATCNVSNKSYNDGDTITFHNITYPIDNALCTSCLCSAGDITDCNSYYCDIGLGGLPIEVCDNWITGEEGVCCPRCGKNNKHLPGLSLKQYFYRWTEWPMGTSNACPHRRWTFIFRHRRWTSIFRRWDGKGREGNFPRGIDRRIESNTGKRWLL